MRKILSILLLTTTIFSSSNDIFCNSLLNKYRIDLSIKSCSGWRRIIKKGQLHKYTDVHIIIEDKYKVEQCIIKSIVLPINIRYLGNIRGL